MGMSRYHLVEYGQTWWGISFKQLNPHALALLMGRGARGQVAAEQEGGRWGRSFFFFNRRAVGGVYMVVTKSLFIHNALNEEDSARRRREGGGGGGGGEGRFIQS